MISSIRNNETNRQYHDDSYFVSCSGFKEFIKAPIKYPAYLRKQAAKEGEKLNLGTATHCAWLERERFAKEYAHIPGPMNVNPFKKMADAAKEAGQIPIGDEMWKNIEGMVNALDRDPDASALLKQGKQELSVRWTDEETGVPMKCRFDTIITDNGIAGDLKTFDSVSMRDVQKQIMRMQYGLQSAWYLRGASALLGKKVTNFVHIFVETEDPWLVIPYALDDASIERADLDVRDGLITFAACLKENVWPGPLPGVRAISLPDWAFHYEGNES